MYLTLGLLFRHKQELSQLNSELNSKWDNAISKCVFVTRARNSERVLLLTDNLILFLKVTEWLDKTIILTCAGELTHLVLYQYATQCSKIITTTHSYCIDCKHRHFILATLWHMQIHTHTMLYCHCAHVFCHMDNLNGLPSY